MKKEHLLLIDMQNDFCHSNGALFVPGSKDNNYNLMHFAKKNIGRWHQIFVTMDSHWSYDIAHPSFWRNREDLPVAPFTFITSSMITNSEYSSNNADDAQKAYDYVCSLEGKAMSHTIWPEHCLVGSWGHLFIDEVQDILTEFQRTHKKAPHIIFKGLNPYSEHFSAFSALVPDPRDATTMFQQEFAQKLLDCDALYVAGQALSHCVGESLSDLYDHIEDKEVFKKIILLLDCTSPVAGFESLAEDYLTKFKSWGITLASTKECGM